METKKIRSARRQSIFSRIQPASAGLGVLLISLTLAFAPPPSQAAKRASKVQSSDMAQLWVPPADIASRDLFHGPGGPDQVPKADAAYRFKKLDSSGHSKGYEVEDPNGRKWKVKVGEEAQAEIVVSRILWAIGYHQPALYFLPKWRLESGPDSNPDPGRFRLESDYKKEGEWSWSDNPFEGTRPFHGLIVANTLLNNWDLTTSNNRIYRLKEAREGPVRWYVVQDVGGALGKTHWPLGSRNDVEDFESQKLIKGVENGHVQFDYHARHGGLMKAITPADVVWTCRLLAQLSDRQMHDAFRAAGYPADVSDRFIRKIKQKIEEGLALEKESGTD